jgi:hypothetical protein
VEMNRQESESLRLNLVDNEVGEKGIPHFARQLNTQNQVTFYDTKFHVIDNNKQKRRPVGEF